MRDDDGTTPEGTTPDAEAMGSEGPAPGDAAIGASDAMQGADAEDATSPDLELADAAAPDPEADAYEAPEGELEDPPLAAEALETDAADAHAAHDEASDDETIGGSGHTLEQLSAYVDRGRTPRVAAIEDDAEAMALVESLERLGGLARTMADEDAAAAGSGDDQWFDGLLGIIRSEVRAGRDLPIEDPDERTSTTITEGALRGVARAAGDGVRDVLVGSVRLTERDGTLDVRVTIGVRFGTPMLPIADEVRVAVHRALVDHAPMAIGAVDVVVDDVFPGGAS